MANVTVGDDFFAPSSSTIHAGDSVVWKWDGSDHNVTSTSHPAAWKASATTTSTTFTFTNTFTNAGTFPYECTVHAFEGMVATIVVTAAAPTPPTVTITNPINGALFAAPATIAIGVTTAATGATVTNVQFLIGSTVVANSGAAPFGAVAQNVRAGIFQVAAIATDGHGLKGTNEVSVQVYTPVSLGAEGGVETAAPGNFQFSYPADVASTYIVERSIDLTNWVPLATNTAAANPATFSDASAPAGAAYYRIVLKPSF